ncbi:MAG TPA: glycosyltransferase [Gemmatimonadaceae bacterium]
MLVFAYACEPETGSEPGAGWALVQAIADFADCVTLVGPEHGARLRRWQAEHRDPRLTFVEVPEPGWARLAKRHRATWFLLYLVWLRRGHRVARRLCAAQRFDLVHHATYSTYWLPSPAVRLGVPCVWGPMGGAVTTPTALWPLLGWIGLLDELLDLLAVRALACLPATRRTWRRAAVRLAQNEATRSQLPDALRASTRVLNHAVFIEVPTPPTRPRERTLLLVTALQTRKGAALALRALRCTPEDVRLAIIGDGPERRALERLARRLGIRHRVAFEGWMPRDRIFTRLHEAAAAVFTGLREEGGIALAEAMLCGTPVIVLANGGARTIAASATDPSRVALIEPGSVVATVRRMGDAMTHFSRRRTDAAGPLLDQSAARAALRAAFEQALATGPARQAGATPACARAS